MGRLKELLTKPGLRPKVVQDCCVLIDEEVASKRGVSGLALKAGYKVFKKVKKDALPSAVDWLLDDFAGVLDKYHVEFERDAEGPTYTDHILARKVQVADDLLAITDARQERSTNRAVKAAYRKLRPTASRYVQEALPRVGAMVERYLAMEP